MFLVPRARRESVRQILLCVMGISVAVGVFLGGCREERGSEKKEKSAQRGETSIRAATIDPDLLATPSLKGSALTGEGGETEKFDKAKALLEKEKMLVKGNRELLSGERIWSRQVLSNGCMKKNIPDDEQTMTGGGSIPSCDTALSTTTSKSDKALGSECSSRKAASEGAIPEDSLSLNELAARVPENNRGNADLPTPLADYLSGGEMPKNASLENISKDASSEHVPLLALAPASGTTKAASESESSPSSTTLGETANASAVSSEPPPAEPVVAVPGIFDAIEEGIQSLPIARSTEPQEPPVILGGSPISPSSSQNSNSSVANSNPASDPTGSSPIATSPSTPEQGNAPKESEGEEGETAGPNPIDKTFFANAPQPRGEEEEKDEEEAGLVIDEAKSRLLEERLQQERVGILARKAAAATHFQAGLELYDKRLYEEALREFDQALLKDPEHADARDFQRRCRQMLGRYGGGDAAVLMDQVVQKAKHEQTATEMALNRDLAEAENLYLGVVKPDAARKALDRMEEIAAGLDDLSRAIEKIERVKTLLATSRLPVESQKTLQLRREALQKQICELQEKLTSERDALAQKRAKEAAEAERQAALEKHKLNVKALLEAANANFQKKEYEKTLDLCDEIEKLDPGNSDALSLRTKARLADQTQRRVELEEELRNSTKNWAIDVEQAYILPKRDLIYPDNWEEIKGRVVRARAESPMSESERMILDRLEGVSLTAEYVETPLSDVVREIQTRAGINIILDKEVNKDTSINMSVRGMTLRRMLEWLMELQNLNYRIEDEAVYIRPATAAGERITLQIYPVADLVRRVVDYKAPLTRLTEDTGETEETKEEEPVNLVEKIPQLVAPKSWEDARTSIDMWEDNLLIRQTPEVHAQIVHYLDRLRETAKQQVLVEGRFLTISDNFMEAIGLRYDLFTWNGVPKTSAYREVRTGMTIRPNQLSQKSEANAGIGLENGLFLSSIDGRRGPTGRLMNDFLHGYQVGALLDAIQFTQQGSVLHNPRLLVQNGKNAYMLVRSRKNYVQSFTIQGMFLQPTIDEQLQGITWDVRPVISFDKKYITIRVRPRMETLLQIHPRASQQPFVDVTVTAYSEYGAQTYATRVHTPVTEIVEIETNGTVPDGGTVLLGGEIRDSRQENMTGIPLLSGIPGLGRLFRQEVHNRDGKNRVIMLQARIVDMEE